MLRRLRHAERPALLDWAQTAAALSASFFKTIVVGTFHPEGTASTTDLLRRTLMATVNGAAAAARSAGAFRGAGAMAIKFFVLAERLG